MEHFTNCAKYNKWKETDKLANLKAALVGDAGQLLWDTAATETDTFSKLVKLLRNRYGGEAEGQVPHGVAATTPSSRRTVVEAAPRRLTALAHPTLTPSEREPIATDH